jgi:DNA polymerase III sliding clamp (beta) subunit (PCNA family)
MVDAKLFSSLVSKITTPFTNLSIEDGKVIVSANGKYDIPLITEEDGSEIFLPDFDFDITVGSNHINNFELKSILTMNKSCKADMKEMPSLFNYYMDGERVITTDYYKACMNPVKVFNNPVCLPPDLVDLISLVADDSGVNVQENDTSVLFSSTNGVLFGMKAAAEDLEAYPANDIVSALNESFDYKCVMNKTDLISALERMCLFTEGFDSNAVTLSFKSDMVTLTTKRNNTSEAVRYISASNYQGESFNISLDGAFLKNQLASSPKEEIIIKFGNESGIELVCDNIIQLSSSLDEEV